MKKIILFIYCSLFIVTINAQTQTQVTFYTSMGDFIVETEDSLAPITTTNFLNLVNQQFYDGIIFHRVINNFVIQGGDPTGTGSGGSGVTIPDEFHPLLSNVERTISMANSGPNTGTSQFFFNMKDNIYLDYNQSPLSSKHPVFGEVISGWNILEDIQVVAVNGSNRPIVDVVMDSVRVTYLHLDTKAITKANLSNFNIYPNPASGQINIELENVGQAKITLMDVLGNEVYSITSNSTLMKVDVSTYSKGIYFVKVESGNRISSEKIIIQ